MTSKEKPKTPRDSRPWAIYRMTSDGKATALTRFDVEEYDSLAMCAKDCATLAIENIGQTFIPVKCGDPVTAQKIEKVVLQ